MRALLAALPLLMVAAAPGQLIAPGPQPRLPVPPAFFGNSIICHDEATGATCQLWLERDGRYRVAFNRGPQTEMPSIDGPWQVEGREGSYIMRDFRGRAQLCLTPDGGAGGFAIERAGEPFAGSGCYDLAAHGVGDRWSATDAQGRTIRFWLVDGR